MKPDVLDEATIARIGERLSRERHGAIVLERLPRAAGSTRWFHCSDKRVLAHIIHIVRPASLVSFYFDNRLAIRTLDEHVRRQIEESANGGSGVVLGILAPDGVEIEVDFPASSREADEFLALAGSASRVLVGPFPAADNDGVAAITAIVPDADGSVRHEPH